MTKLLSLNDVKEILTYNPNFIDCGTFRDQTVILQKEVSGYWRLEIERFEGFFELLAKAFNDDEVLDVYARFGRLA